MTFDIRRKVSAEDAGEDAVEEYTEELFALFVASPEARALDDQEDDFDGFHWAHVLIGFGIFRYLCTRRRAR